MKRWGTQIMGLRDEPQWIVAHRPLSSRTILRTVRMVIPGSGKRRTPATDGQSLLQGNSCASESKSSLGVFEWGSAKCTAFSLDSDLEAFSRNPADGSFAILASQLAAFTKYLNEVFLSY